LTALVLCALFVTLGVGFVWFKNQIGVLGDQIKKSETRLAELERQNRTRRDQLAALCSPWLWMSGSGNWTRDLDRRRRRRSSTWWSGRRIGQRRRKSSGGRRGRGWRGIADLAAAHACSEEEPDGVAAG